MSKIFINLQTGELAFGLERFSNLDQFKKAQRKKCYSILFVTGERIQLSVDFTKYGLQEGQNMICLSPYQIFALDSKEGCSGFSLYFHPDFFCTYRHQNQVESEGVLFGNFHRLPFFKLCDASLFLKLVDHIHSEMERDSIAQHEVLVAFLKIFLIEAVRQKKKFDRHVSTNFFNKQTEILQNLIDAINNNYTTMHSPQEYANMLCLSPKTLAVIAKKYLDQTLSSLIANRILIEAKRELFLTAKPVKQIAASLGYMDEYYFSRFFKKKVGVSPDVYRRTVGFDKLRTL